jgi:hypothetical protein
MAETAKIRRIPARVRRAAAELGRRGGEVKGVKKGFAAMPKGRLRRLSKAAIRKRWASQSRRSKGA